MQTPVGAIGLEGLMNRANIYFTSGYRFSGSIDADALKASFLAIVGAMRKFEYRLHFEAQDRFDWRHADSHRRHFSVVDCDDIDRGFAELCRDSLSLAADNAHCPMALTVLRQRGGNEFIIAQTCEHTYLDARSAEYLFNHLIGHYNAQMRGDEARQHDIVDAVRRVRTITGEKMLEILGLDDETHNQNLSALGRYPVADDGGHAIPLRDVPGCLENYRKQRFAPISRFFALGDLLGRCRQRYPEVTQNSVICAALAKGFYELNRQTKQL